MNGTRALVVQGHGTSMAVNPDEVKEQASIILEHARAGSPAFPKDVSPMQAAELARLALTYGLDPFLGELIIYQGKLYLTIDGRERIANDHPQFDGLEIRPSTAEERTAFRLGEDEHLWICHVWRKDRRVPNVGYGRAGGRSDRNPVSRDYPQEMAQKRAKHRALRDAFSIALPDADELGAGPPRSSGRVIDADTGELEESGPTRRQTVAVHVLAKEAGLEDDAYRALLRETFGVSSSLDLTEGQSAALVELLQARITKPTMFVNRRVLEAFAEDEYPDVEALEPGPPEPPDPPEPEPAPVPGDLLGEPTITDPQDRRWRGWLTLTERVRGDAACSDVVVPMLELPVRVADLEDQFDALRAAAKAAQGAGR
jgi:hypothetical protein